MKIVIVGGGTAGWMATAALAKTFPDYDISIIVGNEPIGVGESTTPHINQYLQYMGLESSSSCSAYFRLTTMTASSLSTRLSSLNLTPTKLEAPLVLLIPFFSFEV